MIVLGKITKNSVTVAVRDLDNALDAVQLEFDPFHMGLEACPTCKAIVPSEQVHHMGECQACFNISIDAGGWGCMLEERNA
jgi:uncharacterized protein (UPF0212 family)